MDKLLLKGIIDELCRKNGVDNNRKDDAVIGLRREVLDFLADLRSGKLQVVERRSA